MEAALAAGRAELLERGRRGLVVDGHGDLRAEHVLLDRSGPAGRRARVRPCPADRGRRMRHRLPGHGSRGRRRRPLAAALVDGYREAGVDPGDRALLATMACYRALVRAKVDLVRGGRGSERARERIEQAVRLRVAGPRPAAHRSVWTAGQRQEHHGARAVRPECHGPPRQTSCARRGRACRQPSGLPQPPTSTRLRCDLRRARRAFGGHAGGRARRGRRRHAGRLGGARCAARRAGGGGGAAALRGVPRRGRGGAPRARRERDAGRESDVTAEVAARLATAWAALDEVPADRHLVVRADRPAGEVARDVAAWLDRAWV